jgi:hypothetical protein
MRKDLQRCLRDCEEQEKQYSTAMELLHLVEKDRHKKLVKLLKLQLRTFDSA